MAEEGGREVLFPDKDIQEEEKEVYLHPNAVEVEGFRTRALQDIDHGEGGTRRGKLNSCAEIPKKKIMNKKFNH